MPTAHGFDMLTTAEEKQYWYRRLLDEVHQLESQQREQIPRLLVALLSARIAELQEQLQDVETKQQQQQQKHDALLGENETLRSANATLESENSRLRHVLGRVRCANEAQAERLRRLVDEELCSSMQRERRAAVIPDDGVEF